MSSWMNAAESLRVVSWCSTLLQPAAPRLALEIVSGVEYVVKRLVHVVNGERLGLVVVVGPQILEPVVEAGDQAVFDGAEGEGDMVFQPVLDRNVVGDILIVAVGFELVRVLGGEIGQVHNARIGRELE